MVDEEQFRRTRTALSTLSCPYEKAILSRVCGCRKAVKTQIGDRESLNCTDEDAQQQCVEFLNQTRKRANFALGLTHMPSALPHALAVKVQCGGLLGLQHALDIVEAPQRVNDVATLLARAQRRYDGLESCPFDQIMRSVAHYEHRSRARRRNKV